MPVDEMTVGDTVILDSAIEEDTRAIEQRQQRCFKIIEFLHNKTLRNLIIVKMYPIYHPEAYKKYEARRGKKTYPPLKMIEEILGVNKRTAMEYQKTLEALQLCDKMVLTQQNLFKAFQCKEMIELDKQELLRARAF